MEQLRKWIEEETKYIENHEENVTDKYTSDYWRGRMATLDILLSSIDNGNLSSLKVSQ